MGVLAQTSSDAAQIDLRDCSAPCRSSDVAGDTRFALDALHRPNDDRSGIERSGHHRVTTVSSGTDTCLGSAVLGSFRARDWDFETISLPERTDTGDRDAAPNLRAAYGLRTSQVLVPLERFVGRARYEVYRSIEMPPSWVVQRIGLGKRQTNRAFGLLRY